MFRTSRANHSLYVLASLEISVSIYVSDNSSMSFVTPLISITCGRCAERAFEGQFTEKASESRDECSSGHGLSVHVFAVEFEIDHRLLLTGGAGRGSRVRLVQPMFVDVKFGLRVRLSYRGERTGT